jgi:hypothetical protein
MWGTTAMGLGAGFRREAVGWCEEESCIERFRVPEDRDFECEVGIFGGGGGGGASSRE